MEHQIAMANSLIEAVKPQTADDVLRAYKALSPSERRKVREKLKLVRSSSATISERVLTLSIVDKTTGVVKSRAKKTAIKESAPSINITVRDKLNTEFQSWHLNALFGDKAVNDALASNNGSMDDRLIAKLLNDNPLPFYTDNTQQYLFMGKAELDERDFGPLTPISSLTALEKFGLAKMEEANERGYARL